MNSEIDFVVLWVNDADENWLNKKSLYDNSHSDDTAQRYRDWGLFKYWFRAVEEYAPWVRTIHLVTDNQIPEWINKANPKLNIVNHSDYMPNEALPVFNSNAIEIGIHRIPNLSNTFVLFNDDVFINDYIDPSYYFNNGVPVDVAGFTRKQILSPDNMFSMIMHNNYSIINNTFSRLGIIKKNFFKWYNISYGKTFIRTVANSFQSGIYGLVIPHLSVPYRINDFVRLWDLYPDLLRDVQYHRFRNSNDLSHYLFRFWRMCLGDFHPRTSLGKYYNLNSQEALSDVCEAITSNKYPELCINDNWPYYGFEAAKNQLLITYASKLPNKSSFEK